MKYIINNNTIFIKYDGENTIIYEENNKYIYKDNIIKNLLNNSCIYYGSTLKGRIASCKHYINNNYKIPILISEKNNIMLFYIKENNNIYWFNYLFIKNYKKLNNKLLIIFNNDQNLILDVSYTIFHNQILKCSRLMIVYSNR